MSLVTSAGLVPGRLFAFDAGSLTHATSRLGAVRVTLVLLRKHKSVLVHLCPLEAAVFARLVLVMRLSEDLFHLLLFRLGTFVSEAFGGGQLTSLRGRTSDSHRLSLIVGECNLLDLSLIHI